MDSSDVELQKFNRTNLFKAIRQVINIDDKILRQDIKQYIWPRLDFMHGQRQEERFFLFEEDYVETEWKDMISVHYINTSYHVQNTVMRVHIFLDKKISNLSYCGFFTLRKIDEARIMLSFIYPDWEKVKYEGASLYVMTYAKKVHIQGRELLIHTYPLFVQDNITVACAQADIISMTKYLHNKFDSNMLRIKNLESAYSTKKTKMFPATGLNPPQMLEVFASCNIPVNYLAINEQGNAESEEYANLYRCYVDYSIESAIPVLIGGIIKDDKGRSSRHVVQVIGHTKQEREKYVVYDDSGCLIRAATKSDGFVSVMDWKLLYEHLSNGDSFLIYPIHEKVYLTYDNMRELLKLRYKSASQLCKLEQNQKFFIDRTRYLLADNRMIKTFLREKLSDTTLLAYEKKQIERILQMNMAHYVWYCEVPLEDRSGFLLSIADPTYGKDTTKDIFYCEVLFTANRLSLLSYNGY